MVTAVRRSQPISQRVEQARLEFGLPETARKLLVSDAFRGGDQHATLRWLMTDRDLAIQVLRWCNTPMYCLARPYRDLGEAISMVDPGDMARLTLLAFLRQRYMAVSSIAGLTAERLWRHQLAVGAVASMISRVSLVGDPGESFLAGILHDVGVVASLQLQPAQSSRMISEVDELSSLDEIERERYGWTHADLGAEILRQWDVPESVCHATELHHLKPGQFDAADDPTTASLVIANYLCSRTGWGSVAVHNLATPDNRLFASLEIDSDMLSVIWHQLHDTFGHVAAMVAV